MSFSLLFVRTKNNVGKLAHGRKQFEWLGFNWEE